MKRISLRLVVAWIVIWTAVAESQSLAQTPREIAEKAMPSVVALVMEDADGRAVAQGSGFVVSAGVVATNWHVAEGAARGYAKLLNSDDRFQIAGIVASDEARDLVLLAVDGLAAPPLPIADSNSAAVGDAVFVLGSPRGLEGTFSAGLISSIRRFKDGPIFQMTAPISEGSSGGPVLNAKGEVIAVSFATIEAGQNLNFAVPSVFLSALIAQRGAVRPLNAAETHREVPAEFERDSF